jgi:hypothetical protein
MTFHQTVTTFPIVYHACGGFNVTPLLGFTYILLFLHTHGQDDTYTLPECSSNHNTDSEQTVEAPTALSALGTTDCAG